jgi:hypothetical protein
LAGSKQRIACFVDGFNLYHAIARLGKPHLNEARKGSYDTAQLISRDSDLAPAIRMVRSEFPEKRVRLIAPPNLGHSKELARAVDRKALSSIKEIHLERSQFPDEITDPVTGAVLARRPFSYVEPA